MTFCRKSFVFLFVLSFFNASGALAEAVTASDSQYGIDLYCLTIDVLTGNLGTLIGLLLAFSGFVMFILNGGSANIVTIVLGIAITAYPGLYQAFLIGMSYAMSGANNVSSRSYIPAECDVTITPDSVKTNIPDTADAEQQLQEDLMAEEIALDEEIMNSIFNNANNP